MCMKLLVLGALTVSFGHFQSGYRPWHITCFQLRRTEQGKSLYVMQAAQIVPNTAIAIWMHPVDNLLANSLEKGLVSKYLMPSGLDIANSQPPLFCTHIG